MIFSSSFNNTCNKLMNQHKNSFYGLLGSYIKTILNIFRING